MSGRRSSNPRWLAWGIAVAICSLASAGVGLATAHATAAASTIFAGEAPRLGSASTPSAPARLGQRPQTRGVDPRPNINRRGPRFVVQPRLVGRNLFFVVKVNPHRTANRHRSANPDLLRGRVDVSLRGVAIRTVGLDPKTRAEKLIFTTRLKQRVIRRAGRIEYRIRLPLAVARSLAATSVRNRTTRVRVVLVHAKDTKPSLRWRETLMLAQSSIESLPTARSRAATNRLRTAPRDRHVDNIVFTSYQLANNTPFTLQVSTQPTQCVTGTQYTGPMFPGQVIGYDAYMEILYSGSPNSLSTWQDLSQDAVTALKGAAIEAANDALILALVDAAIPEEAILEGELLAADFVKRFITNALLTKTCNDTPATWVISAVAIGLPLPLWQGPFGGATWAVNSAGQPVSSGPVQTPAQLAQTIGGQTSVQWSWNGGKIAPNGPGASYFSGGLLQTTGYIPPVWTGYEGSVFTTISYQNNAQTSYGPIPTSNVTLTAIPDYTTDPNDPWVNLTCNTGAWLFFSPWSNYSYPLSNPPNFADSATLVTSFYYNGVNGSGQSVTGQPIPAQGSVPSDYTDFSQVLAVVTQGTIASIIASNGGGSITSWGCLVQAHAQQPSFQPPNGLWPVNVPTFNLGWYSQAYNATAPNPFNPNPTPIPNPD